MFAESATIGNEYIVTVILRSGHARKAYKGTCIGWNHTHTKVLFTIIDRGFRIGVAIFPTEFVQAFE